MGGLAGNSQGLRSSDTTASRSSLLYGKHPESEIMASLTLSLCVVIDIDGYLGATAKTETQSTLEP